MKVFKFEKVDFSQKYMWKTQGRVAVEQIYTRYQDEIENGLPISLFIDEDQYAWDEYYSIISPLLQLTATTDLLEPLQEQSLDFSSILGLLQTYCRASAEAFS